MENTKSSNPVVATSFQNGNAIITPQVSQYIRRYEMFVRKTAESIIGLATTLVDAEQNLNGVDFACFCDEVGLEKGSSNYSKLRKIGLNASRFTPYLESLPNTWTTLYELAKIEPTKFEQIASDLTPFMTAKEVTAAVGGMKNEKEKQVIDLSISFGNIGSANKKEVYDAINELKKQFKFNVKEGQLFIDEMKTVNKKKVA